LRKCPKKRRRNINRHCSFILLFSGFLPGDPQDIRIRDGVEQMLYLWQERRYVDEDFCPHSRLMPSLMRRYGSSWWRRGHYPCIFPTTRRPAEFLEVPHYYVLPYFAMMEQDQLVTRAERVGIMTTGRGTEKFIAMMNERYPDEAMQVLGPVVFEDILKRVSPDRSVYVATLKDTRPPP
jgi:hypothetical protein